MCIFAIFRKKKKRLSAYELGKYGEELASRYLKKNGYIILERNYKCIYGEVDIIAKNNDCIVFVEIKTRKKIREIMPEDSIGYSKKQHLLKSAEYYISTLPDEVNYRFDVVSIELNDLQPEIYIIKDAF